MACGCLENVRTIIPHGDVRDDLLQHRLALDKLLVLRLSCMEVCPEFLYAG
jgi:hypothetical protein